jgi:hypothetical protein
MQNNFLNFFEDHIQQLDEAVKIADFDKVARLIQKYLKKYVAKVFYYPGVEEFSSSKAKGMKGIRFFVQGGASFRINWSRQKQIRSNAGVVSMDYWDGTVLKPKKPTTHIEFKNDESLATVLPFIRDFLNAEINSNGKKIDKSGIYFDDDKVRNVNEAYTDPNELAETTKKVIASLQANIPFKTMAQTGGAAHYGAPFNKVVGAIKMVYKPYIKKQGVSLVVNPEDAKKFEVKKVVEFIVGDSVSFSVSSGNPETIEVRGVEQEDLDRMTYEEQLESLKTGMKLLMANATSSLWIAGRGGTGKTQTVEDMLHAAGLKDGDGYFKITGSASPTGIYRILYDHRDSIILFDDSDSALGDTEGRNLFKAAADTKKIRKISWMKGGKQFINPDDFTDEDLEAGYLPRYFEFSGKIIFISNLPLDKLDPDGALRTRGFVMNVDPTNEEIYEFMGKIAGKIVLDVDYNLSLAARLEVIEVLRTRNIKEKSANLRSLVRGLNTRAGVESQGGSSSEWRKFVKTYA